MGFKPERTIYKLSFKGTPLDGLEIRVGSLTVAEYNEMLAKGTVEKATEVAEANQWVAEKFLEKLVDWNLDGDDGQPLPRTVEAFQSLERPVVNSIIQAWQIALVQVPDPLSSGSNSGSISQELELGLGDSSQNL